MSEHSEQVWQNLHNSLERTASERDALRARVAALEAGRSDLISTIETMNEENAQLAHRLWCLENPE